MRKGLSRLLSWERQAADAEVLVVTNMWPHAEDPFYGIFVKRQVEAQIKAGLNCDILFIHGFRSKAAYAAAGALLLWLGLRRRPSYRLVHAHGGETALPARCYLRGAVMVSYCGDDLLGSRREDGTLPLAQRIRRSVLRQHARLLTASVTKSAELEQALPRSCQRRNIVVPSGVDCTVFRPIDRLEARRQLGWSPEARIVLFAARPGAASKRASLARAACDRARLTFSDLELYVAAQEPPEQMPILMNAADCLLLTSASEGSPNVVKEAAACNLPVVTTSVGDVNEVLTGVTPSYICTDSAQDLASALIECLATRERSNGRDGMDRLAVEATGSRLMARYSELMEQSPRCQEVVA